MPDTRDENHIVHSMLPMCTVRVSVWRCARMEEPLGPFLTLPVFADGLAFPFDCGCSTELLSCENFYSKDLLCCSVVYVHRQSMCFFAVA